MAHGKNKAQQKGEEESWDSKKKKSKKCINGNAFFIEMVMAKLEVSADVDAELNVQGKPATKKLTNLHLLTSNLAKKHLQSEFLDHGILTLLKNWLEPLPDGSLPSIDIRTNVLSVLLDLPIDLEQHCRKEQLMKSGIGRVIKFLSKSEEETTANRKLAKELIDKWSRSLFGKSTYFGDAKKVEDERTRRKPFAKKPRIEKPGSSSCHNQFALAGVSQASSSRQAVLWPEAMPMDFVVRPKSKVDPDEIRARARRTMANQRREKLSKKLEQMRASKRKKLQATKISVDGRGMVKYV